MVVWVLQKLYMYEQSMKILRPLTCTCLSSLMRLHRTHRVHGAYEGHIARSLHVYGLTA